MESRGDMGNKEGYVFWRLANSFISDHGYRIIQLFENQKELWLEKIENKKAPIIRMLLHNLDWSNAMQRDIQFTASNGEKVRRQIGRPELNIINIYISQFPPVDEYEYRLAAPYVHPEGNKTTVSSFLLAKEVFDTGFQQLSTRLGKVIHFPISDDYSEQEVESLKKATLEHAIKKVKTERAILMNSKPIFTYVFIAIQLVMFFWLEIHGGSTNNSTLIKYGAKVNHLIYMGEWWRFITPIFLHSGFLHLAMNTLVLYFLGTTVEKIFGNVRFLFIYLFAGVAGCIASFIFSSLSVGASGAIYGCFGALLYFGMIYPKLFSRTLGMNLIIVLGINLIVSFSVTGIDSAAHLGGLAGGFLAGGIVHFPKKNKLWLQLTFLIGSVAIVWGALSYGFSSVVKSQDETSNLQMAQEYIKQNNYDQAYRILKEFEESSTNLSEKTYFLLSFSEIKKGMLSEAKMHLQKAIQLDPNFDEAYFNLSIINYEQKDFEQAKVNAEKAAKLKPKQKEYEDLVHEINQLLQMQGGPQNENGL
ncbi:serine protease of Rhomboid family, contains TPR repeats [Neobacillus vireti LMG 21834]|uniref:Serine protease of Rhomboid family, contains TPR repeats n=2 Tax=Neobacillus TaxID=2675232 RepID=A0AB94IJ62_9BACI|nr:serine protease of Rhomboid family, contains TPR repeats [Neobacillus vireti LMG 21834]